jgi:hypothetical protein
MVIVKKSFSSPKHYESSSEWLLASVGNLTVENAVLLGDG